MAVEILDGTIEPAEPARSKRGYLMFDSLRFRDRKGGTRELKKMCCGGDVGTAVRKGGPGRYYLSSGGGQTGIHGVRMDDGTRAYAHYTNMEKIIPFGIAAGIVALVLGLVMNGELMLIPLIVTPGLLVAYFFMRSIRLAGKQQYEGDSAA
ncbi:MAG: hypothetical protein ABIS39_08765 [Sphingomicrobium sp.]